MNDHYKTLGVQPSAESTEIKKAYFELAKKYHPDAGDADQIKKFYEIAEAYKTLSDKELKKVYDKTLGEGMDIIKTAEQEIISNNPVYPTAHVQRRESYRDVELKEFHRNRYLKAVYRVVVYTLFLLIGGALLALVLKGNYILGALSGLLIGFSHSLRQNFDIDTFFAEPKKQKLFRAFTWLILIAGFLYFVLLTAPLVLK